MVSFVRRCGWGLLVIVYLGFAVQAVHGQYKPVPVPTAPKIPPIPAIRVPPPKIDTNKINDNFRNWQRNEEQKYNVAPHLNNMPNSPTAKKSADGKFAQAAFIVVLIVAGLTVLCVIARIFIGLRFSRDPQQLALNDPSVRAYLKPTEAVNQVASTRTQNPW
jgi:hypothetical protein